MIIYREQIFFFAVTGLFYFPALIGASGPVTILFFFLQEYKHEMNVRKILRRLQCLLRVRICRFTGQIIWIFLLSASKCSENFLSVFSLFW
jgi:hypothetical protein